MNEIIENKVKEILGEERNVVLYSMEFPNEIYTKMKEESKRLGMNVKSFLMFLIIRYFEEKEKKK